MTIFFSVLFAICCIAECVCVPIFLKYQWPQKCWKSFRWKMVCSALFFSCGLLAMKIGNNHTQYATLIMFGLLFGWLGDLFLHIISDNIIFSGLGIFSFLAGHIFYIIAFQKAIYINYPDASAVAWYELVFVFVIVGLLALFAKIKNLKFPKYTLVPVLMYAITISYMLIKAIRLCVSMWAYGTFDNIILLFLTVGLGAILFVLSDGSLGMIMGGIMADNKHFKWFNIGTYYLAQVLLASSIFLIYTKTYLN